MLAWIGNWGSVLWNWTKLFGFLALVSASMAVQVIIFFTLQDVWKAWVGNEIDDSQFTILTILVVGFYTPFLCVVLLFTRASQNQLKNIFN